MFFTPRNLSPALLLLLALQSTVVWPDWRVEEKVDAMTDEMKKSASVTNDLGHKFSIYRLVPDGAVWANFSLSDSSLDQLSAGKPLLFRVDKNSPHEITVGNKAQQALMRLDIRSSEWKPKWVNFLIWHGKEDEGRAESLVQIMEGKTVVFRYYLFTGGYKDTEFTLKGASPAIAAALGISAEVDHAKQAESTEFRNAFADAMNQCPSGKALRPCYDKVTECRKKSEGKAQAFKLCLASATND